MLALALPRELAHHAGGGGQTGKTGAAHFTPNCSTSPQRKGAEALRPGPNYAIESATQRLVTAEEPSRR